MFWVTHDYTTMRGVWKKNLTFLKSILNEKNRYQRMEKLLHANKDQINAVSEMTLNLFKNHVPISQAGLKTLARYKTPLRTLGNRKASLKTRRNVLMTQSGAGFWKGLKYFHQCCCQRRKRKRAWRQRQA